MDTSRPTKESELWLALSDEDKLLPILSFSRLQMLDRCEYQHYLAYGLGYMEKERAKPLELGGICHEGLAAAYIAKRDEGMPFTVFAETRLQELTEQWMASGRQEALIFAGHISWLLSRYFSQADAMDDGHTILEVEYHFLIKVKSMQGRPFLLQGYVDLVTRDRAGRVWLWDHKTGQKFWTKIEVSADAQLPLYAIALREEGMVAHGTIINMLNTYDYKDKSKVLQEQLFKREPLPRSDQELISIAENVLHQADDWLDAHEGNWPHGKPLRSMSKDCKYCRFADPCLSALKGIPVEILLEDSFKKKETKPVPSTIQVEGFEI